MNLIVVPGVLIHGEARRLTMGATLIFVVNVFQVSFVQAGPFDGAIIVSSNNPGDTDYLSIYSRTGQLLQHRVLDAVSIQGSGGSLERPRGVVLDANSKIQLFHGTTNTRLYSYDAESQSSIITKIFGWGLGGNVYYGSIDAYRNYIYLPDMAFFTGDNAGIVRVNADTLAAEFFPLHSQDIGWGVSSLTIGLNGLLYARFVSQSKFYVYDPITMQQVNVVDTIYSTSGGFAVGADGTIYAGSGSVIVEIPGDGSPTQFHFTPTTGNNISGFRNIDVHADGTIVAGNGEGEVYLTDINFSTSFLFKAQTPFKGENFVAFYALPVPEPSTLALGALAALSIACKAFISRMTKVGRRGQGSL